MIVLTGAVGGGVTIVEDIQVIAAVTTRAGAAKIAGVTESYSGAISPNLRRIGELNRVGHDQFNIN